MRDLQRRQPSIGDSPLQFRVGCNPAPNLLWANFQLGTDFKHGKLTCFKQSSHRGYLGGFLPFSLDGNAAHAFIIPHSVLHALLGHTHPSPNFSIGFAGAVSCYQGGSTDVDRHGKRVDFKGNPIVLIW